MSVSRPQKANLWWWGGDRRGEDCKIETQKTRWPVAQDAAAIETKPRTLFWTLHFEIKQKEFSSEQD